VVEFAVPEQPPEPVPAIPAPAGLDG
jgi:hypothetical protein